MLVRRSIERFDNPVKARSIGQASVSVHAKPLRMTALLIPAESRVLFRWDTHCRR